MTTLDAAKRATFESALEIGRVCLYFDGRAQGVDVPPPHMQQPRVMFRIGSGLTPPTPVDSDALGFSVTLQFGAVSYVCRIPWSAVFAIREETRGEITMVAPTSSGVTIHDDAPVVESAPAKPRPKFGLVPMPEDEPA